MRYFLYGLCFILFLFMGCHPQRSNSLSSLLKHQRDYVTHDFPQKTLANHLNIKDLFILVDLNEIFFPDLLHSLPLEYQLRDESCSNPVLLSGYEGAGYEYQVWVLCEAYYYHHRYNTFDRVPTSHTLNRINIDKFRISDAIDNQRLLSLIVRWDQQVLEHEFFGLPHGFIFLATRFTSSENSSFESMVFKEQ